MDPAIIAVAFVVGFGVLPRLLVAALHRRRARERVAFWGQAAGEAGLSGIETTRDGLTASSGSLLVRLSTYQENEGRGTRVEIWSPRLAPSLTLRTEGVGALLGFRDGKEIEVGDDDFDKQVSVRGTPALALALLNAELRGTMRRLLRGRLVMRGHPPLWATGRLEEGVLRVDVPERSAAARGNPERPGEEPAPAGDAYLDGEYKLPAVLRAALDLAARLVAPDDLAQRIASNLATEPEPRVRLRAFLTLLREFPEHAATREALAAAREDPDADVRVRAGIALGADGRDVLLGVAGGEGAEDVTSARAVAALVGSLTLEQASELLRNALRTRRAATARVCLGMLARHGAKATPTLAKVLLVERGELGEAAAEALAATGDPAAEASLLRALGSGSTGLRRAAATALGRVGTPGAVAPLRAAESQDAALRGAARQAIAEIQSRLAGAAPGQLSLAGGEAGRLSLAEDEAGRLSLASDERDGAGAETGRRKQD